jgi:ATP-dependent Clp protease ATP-binding subunit ClpC
MLHYGLCPLDIMPSAGSMYERFNQEARRAIFFADREAREVGSSYVEPEHLLLGLIHETGSKANQLFALAAHAESFRQQLRSHRSAKSSKSVDFPLSNAAKCVLVYTAEEADRLTSKPIGTEHLLLGLLREKEFRRAGSARGSWDQSAFG